MFQNKKQYQKMWIVMAIIIVLVVAMVIMQAQILAIVKDLQTFFLKDYVISNPLPPVLPDPTGIEDILDSNPLPPVMPQ